jgi:hypothetical protein
MTIHDITDEEWAEIENRRIVAAAARRLVASDASLSEGAREALLADLELEDEPLPMEPCS